jgi:sarcosine oxidase subunit alpha
MPARYKNTESEVDALKKAVGIGDISFNGKLSLKGRAITEFSSDVFSNPVSCEVGEVARATTRQSRISCLLCKLSRDEIMILTKTGEAIKAEGDIITHKTGCAHLTNVTSSQAGINLVGPFSTQVLMKMTDVDVAPRKFQNMKCAQGGVARIPTVIIRNDVAGLTAFELYFSRELGEYMWEAVVQDGREFGIKPFGLDAREKVEA